MRSEIEHVAEVIDKIGFDKSIVLLSFVLLGGAIVLGLRFLLKNNTQFSDLVERIVKYSQVEFKELHKETIEVVNHNNRILEKCNEINEKLIKTIETSIKRTERLESKVESIERNQIEINAKIK